MENSFCLFYALYGSIAIAVLYIVHRPVLHLK
jgi:hypothetical protein